MNDKEAVRNFLKELLERNGDTDAFADNEILVDNGRLHSIDMVELVLFLEQNFGVNFAASGFNQDQLGSVEAIVEFLAHNSQAV